MNTDTKIILEKLDKIDTRLDKMDTRFDSIDTRFERLEDDVHGIHLILENEINRDIKIIAEGHLGLWQKMDELLEKESKNDQLAIDVLWLKNKVTAIDKRLDSIAI